LTGLYVDTSALLKRLFVEDGSAGVREILRQRNASGDLLASSAIAWLEVARAVLRAGIGDVDQAIAAACAGIARYPLHPTVMNRAQRLGPATLRSLDAIHLASAVSLGVTEILTFDRRLAQAAEAVGVKAIP
jgi:predicted nucleic acid-binding protein